MTTLLYAIKYFFNNNGYYIFDIIKGMVRRILNNDLFIKKIFKLCKI